MNHQRQIIREAIVAGLITAGTTASTRVYDTPVDPRTQFPAITVEDTGEGQEVTSGMGGGWGNRLVERTLQILVSAEVVANATYAKDRDQLLASVEAAMSGMTIAGVKSISPTGYQPDLDNSGERPIAVGRQRFEVAYVTPQGNPASNTF